MALTYYPGWEIWNGKCHENQGDIPSQIWEDKAKATAGIYLLQKIEEILINKKDMNEI